MIIQIILSFFYLFFFHEKEKEEDEEEEGEREEGERWAQNISKREVRASGGKGGGEDSNGSTMKGGYTMKEKMLRKSQAIPSH